MKIYRQEILFPSEACLISYQFLTAAAHIAVTKEYDLYNKYFLGYSQEFYKHLFIWIFFAKSIYIRNKFISSIVQSNLVSNSVLYAYTSGSFMKEV